MIQSLQKQRKSFSHRFLSCLILTSFICNLSLPSLSFAQIMPQPYLNLPAPGTMVPMSPAFMPAMIKGLQLDLENPLKFNFIVDTGDTKLQGDALKSESTKLIKYFLTALTVPEDQLWVNLSPYEKDRIAADGLGKTEMGRDMLAQDYILKQMTASLIYPEGNTGKKFWEKIYVKAREKYGTTDVPVSTFNKVWIVPEHALIYEKNGTAYVVENKLKVMLEEDYLALMKNMGNAEIGLDKTSKGEAKDFSKTSSDVVRELVIPELEKEVNAGKNFANLRQIANAVVLATWYKQNLKESLLGQVYVNQNKIKGVDAEDKNAKLKIYNQYLEAFKKGAYNYIKEEYDFATRDVVIRKYFSGGAVLDYTDKVSVVMPGQSSSGAAEREIAQGSHRGKESMVAWVAVENAARGTLEQAIQASSSGAPAMVGTPVSIPQRFGKVLAGEKYGLVASDIRVSVVKGIGDIHSLLSDFKVRYILESSTAAALGSFFLRGQRSTPSKLDVKKAADANALKFIEDETARFVAEHPEYSVVELASEGLRDGSVSTPVGRIYHQGLGENNYIDTVAFEFDAKGKGKIRSFDKDRYVSTLDQLRVKGVTILYKISDSLEKTEGLVAPEAKDNPTDSWAMNTFMVDTGTGPYRLPIDDNFRTAGISYHALKKAEDLGPLDLPSVAIPKIARANGITLFDAQGNITSEYKAFLEKVVMVTLGPRGISIKDADSSDERHAAIIADGLRFMEAMHTGYEVQLRDEAGQTEGMSMSPVSDGDLITRLAALSGSMELTDNKIYIDFGRSGSAEAEAARAFAKTVPGARMVSRRVSTAATAKNVSYEKADGYANEEREVNAMLGYEDGALTQVSYDEEQKVPTYVSMTSVTGATNHLGNNFRDAMQRVTVNPDNKTITTTTLMTDAQGNIYTVQVDYKSSKPALRDSIREVLNAHPLAQAVVNEMPELVPPAASSGAGMLAASEIQRRSIEMRDSIYFGGNWKERKNIATEEQARAKAREFKAKFATLPADTAAKAKIIIFSEAKWVKVIAEELKGSGILVGVQSLFFDPEGDLRAQIDQAVQMGATYANVAHSMHRAKGLTNEQANKIMRAILEDGRLIPWYTIEETGTRDPKEEISQAIDIGLKGIPAEVIATFPTTLEPTVLISTQSGTGVINPNLKVSGADALQRTMSVRDFFRSKYHSEAIANDSNVGYGASVKSSNAQEIFSQPVVRNALIGGASLEADEFFNLVVNAIKASPARASASSGARMGKVGSEVKFQRSTDQIKWIRRAWGRGKLESIEKDILSDLLELVKTLSEQDLEGEAYWKTVDLFTEIIVPPNVFLSVDEAPAWLKAKKIYDMKFGELIANAVLKLYAVYKRQGHSAFSGSVVKSRFKFSLEQYQKNSLARMYGLSLSLQKGPIERLIENGAKYSDKTKSLLLITPQQFNDLPPGTVLKTRRDPYLSVTVGGKEAIDKTIQDGVLMYGIDLSGAEELQAASTSASSSGARMVEGAEIVPVDDIHRQPRADGDPRIKFETAGWRGRIDVLGDFSIENVGRFTAGTAEEFLQRVQDGTYTPVSPKAGIKILVAYDSREGGDHYAQEIYEVLSAHQGIIPVMSDGILHTPGVTAQTRESLAEYDGAIQVTASHNEPGWLGLKFLHRGSVNPKSWTNYTEKRANDKRSYPRLNHSENLKSLSEFRTDNVVTQLTARYRQIFPDLGDRFAAFKSKHGTTHILDVMHGGLVDFVSMLTSWNLSALNTSPMRDRTYPKTTNKGTIWKPDPTKKENLDHVKLQEFERNAPDGSTFMATDGDGDRLVNYVKRNGVAYEIEPNIFAPFAIWYLNKKGMVPQDAKIVVRSMATSRLMDAVAKKLGYTLEVTPVGSRFFEPYMIDSSQRKAAVAVEETGHIAIRVKSKDGGVDEVFFDDTVFQIGLLLSMMADEDKGLDKLLDEFETFVQFTGVFRRDDPKGVKEQIVKALGENPRTVAQKIIDAFPGKRVIDSWVVVEVGETDETTRSIKDLNPTDKIKVNEGVGVQWDDYSWGLIRVSGTEDSGRVYSFGTPEERPRIQDALYAAVGLQEFGATRRDSTVTASSSIESVDEDENFGKSSRASSSPDAGMMGLTGGRSWTSYGELPLRTFLKQFILGTPVAVTQRKGPLIRGTYQGPMQRYVKSVNTDVGMVVETRDPSTGSTHRKEISEANISTIYMDRARLPNELSGGQASSSAVDLTQGHSPVDLFNILSTDANARAQLVKEETTIRIDDEIYGIFERLEFDHIERGTKVIGITTVQSDRHEILWNTNNARTIAIHKIAPATASSSNVEGQKQNLGGINLNPALLNLQIKRDGNGIPLPMPQQPIGTMKIEGFMPVIINITPITNLPLMLGIGSKESRSDELSLKK